MWPFKVLSRLPKKWRTNAFFVTTTLQTFFRYFTSNLYGIFYFSVFLYGLDWFAGVTRPLTFHEIIMWFDGLPTASKTTFATSALTIVGFLVAFQSSNSNWKFQAKTQLKLDLATDLVHFLMKHHAMPTY
jgi:hypothetical protein